MRTATSRSVLGVVLLALALSTPSCRTATPPAGGDASAPPTNPPTPKASPQPESPAWFIDRLGDQTITVEQRKQYVDAIRVRMDHQMIDALVEHLDDKRVFDPVFYPSAMDYNDDGPPPTYVLTVGGECQCLVQAFIFPGTKTGFLGRVDFASWWKARRHLPLGEIVRQAREADDGAPAVPGIQPAPKAPPPPGSAAWLVDRLGDKTIAFAQRLAYAQAIEKRMDHEMIDALVDHFDDKRVFDAAEPNNDE